MFIASPLRICAKAALRDVDTPLSAPVGSIYLAIATTKARSDLGDRSTWTARVCMLVGGYESWPSARRHPGRWPSLFQFACFAPFRASFPMYLVTPKECNLKIYCVIRYSLPSHIKRKNKCFRFSIFFGANGGFRRARQAKDRGGSLIKSGACGLLPKVFAGYLRFSPSFLRFLARKPKPCGSISKHIHLNLTLTFLNT